MTQPIQNPISYATVTQTDSFPKKDQAIVIDAIDNTQLKEYTDALSKLIKPTSIRFISRIANNRICVYVATKELANELIDKHKLLHIKGQHIAIRPLITRNKRIVLSNVCPVIPHEAIKKNLEDLNITPQSPITFLRAGFTEPGFSHILSFRRQVYIAPEDIDKLPDSLQISFDETNYWIYLSTDSMHCFTCKNIGHIAKNCPEVLNKVNVGDLPSEPIILPDSRSVLKHPHPPSSDSSQQITNQRIIEDNDEVNVMSDDASCFSDTSSSIDLAKNVRKKKKTSTADKDFKIADWDNIKSIISSSSISYPMDYLEFKSFLENTHGVQDISAICAHYSKDPSSIIKMLTELYPHFTNRSIKNRITRLQRKLKLLLSKNKNG